MSKGNYWVILWKPLFHRQMDWRMEGQTVMVKTVYQLFGRGHKNSGYQNKGIWLNHWQIWCLISQVCVQKYQSKMYCSSINATYCKRENFCVGGNFRDIFFFAKISPQVKMKPIYDFIKEIWEVSQKLPPRERSCSDWEEIFDNGPFSAFFNDFDIFKGPFLIILHSAWWAIFQVNGTMAHGPCLPNHWVLATFSWNFPPAK